MCGWLAGWLCLQFSFELESRGLFVLWCVSGVPMLLSCRHMNIMKMDMHFYGIRSQFCMTNFKCHFETIFRITFRSDHRCCCCWCLFNEKSLDTESNAKACILCVLCIDRGEEMVPKERHWHKEGGEWKRAFRPTEEATINHNIVFVISFHFNFFSCRSLSRSGCCLSYPPHILFYAPELCTTFDVQKRSSLFQQHFNSCRLVANISRVARVTHFSV